MKATARARIEVGAAFAPEREIPDERRRRRARRRRPRARRAARTSVREWRSRRSPAAASARPRARLANAAQKQVLQQDYRAHPVHGRAPTSAANAARDHETDRSGDHEAEIRAARAERPALRARASARNPDAARNASETRCTRRSPRRRAAAPVVYASTAFRPAVSSTSQKCEGSCRQCTSVRGLASRIASPGQRRGEQCSNQKSAAGGSPARSFGEIRVHPGDRQSTVADCSCDALDGSCPDVARGEDAAKGSSRVAFLLRPRCP